MTPKPLVEFELLRDFFFSGKSARVAGHFAGAGKVVDLRLGSERDVNDAKKLGVLEPVPCLN
jgi:hypothetical protein